MSYAYGGNVWLKSLDENKREIIFQLEYNLYIYINVLYTYISARSSDFQLRQRK